MAPTLRVGASPRRSASPADSAALRPKSGRGASELHSHAERGNDQGKRHMAPMLRVGASPRRSESPADSAALRPTSGRGASRLHYHAERGNDQGKRHMAPMLRVGASPRRSASPADSAALRSTSRRGASELHYHAERGNDQIGHSLRSCSLALRAGHCSLPSPIKHSPTPPAPPHCRWPGAPAPPAKRSAVCSSPGSGSWTESWR